MKRRLSILVAVVLTMVMSISVALAEYKSEGSIILPAASASTKNAIADNRKDAYAWTHGSTNAYVSVKTTVYYFNPSTETYYSINIPKASGSINANNDAPNLSGSNYYYKVTSTHTASYDVYFDSMDLTTIVP